MPTNSKNLHFGLAVAFCLSFPFLIYFHSLHADFIFDDFAYIVDNPLIKRPIMPGGNNFPVPAYVQDLKTYRPLFFQSLVLNYRYCRLDPFGYHLMNVSLHALNALLIFFLTRKIFILVYQNSGLFWPLVTTSLFTAHPIHTEVVTYITHRSDSIATFFYLLAILLFAESCRSRQWLYVASLLSFIAALCGKEIAATLPAMILAFDFFFLSDGQFGKIKKNIFRHLPFWVILMVYILLQYITVGQIGYRTAESFQRWTTLSYFMVQPSVILQYIRLLFVPTRLCIDHWILPDKMLLSFRTISSFILLAAVPISAYFLGRKHPAVSKLVLFGVLWFFVTLSPTASFLPIHDAMTERRLYLPGWGFTLILTAFYHSVFNHVDSKLLLKTLLGAHIFVLSFLTLQRNEKYRNPIVLWKEAVQYYPNNDRALNNLANMYRDRGELDNALSAYIKAIEVNPGIPGAIHNIGTLYIVKGDLNRAQSYFRQAIAAEPEFAEAYNDLGYLHLKRKEMEKAIPLIQKAIRLKPDLISAYYNLGVIYFSRKDYAQAERIYRKIIALNPDLPSTYNYLAILYFEQKRYPEALAEYRYALLLMPGDPLILERIRSLEKILAR